MFSFDVVIVDYLMPEMNGHELAIAMRRLRPQAPIIMLSGTTDIFNINRRSVLFKSAHSSRSLVGERVLEFTPAVAVWLYEITAATPPEPICV